MYGKLVALFALAAVALAREYPPGLHPSVCPNYPNCDPAIFFRFTPGGMPIPGWPYPGTAYSNPPHALRTDMGVGVAAKYPADFDAAMCPNYPHCW